MAGKKKPTPEQLNELQSLFKSLESDVGISKVDEQLLQKFEMGELSKEDATKLQSELRSAASTKVPPFPGAEALKQGEVKLPPNLRLKNDTIDVPFSKVEGPSIPAMRTTQAAETGLVPMGERALQKIPGVPEATVNVVKTNPVLKKLMLPILVTGAGGAALYAGMSGGEEKKAAVQEPPASAPTPAAPEAPAPAPAAAAAEPSIKKAPPLHFDKYMQSMEQINKRYEQDRQISPELKTQFEQRQAGLERALSDARSIYEKSVSTAQSEADRREAMTQWASIAESLGQSMVKYFAAREGARTGQLLGSKLQFEKYDWAKDLDRNIARLKQQTDQAKTILGIAREDVETGAKALGEERKAAMQERETVAKQRAGMAEDLTKEQLRQEARSVEDYIEAQNRMALEGARETKAQAAVTKKEEAVAAKEQASAQKVQMDNYAKLEGALRSIAKKDTQGARKEIGDAAAMLGIPADEVDDLIDFGTGKLMYSSSAEQEKIRSILDKYNPGQAAPAPAPAPAGGEQMVDMISPQGKLLRVPASEVKALEAKGARRK